MKEGEITEYERSKILSVARGFIVSGDTARLLVGSLVLATARAGESTTHVEINMLLDDIQVASADMKSRLWEMRIGYWRDCQSCRENWPDGPTGEAKMGPSHEGSVRCESGSIASGGTREHCCCDSCY